MFEDYENKQTGEVIKKQNGEGSKQTSNQSIGK